MSPCLFNEYMDGVVWEVNVNVELLRANDGRFEIKELLFANDTALAADSEKLLLLLLFLSESVRASPLP